MTTQTQLIQGFQYSPTSFMFIGEYFFPNNEDKDEIHMPPNTTLVPPPDGVPDGFSVYWRDGAWVLDNDTDSTTKITFPDVHKDDLTEEFVQDCKNFGIYEDLMRFYEGRPDLTAPIPDKAPNSTWAHPNVPTQTAHVTPEGLIMQPMVLENSNAS